MNAPLRLALAGVAVVAVAVGGLYVLNRGPDAPGNVGGLPSPSPTPSLPPSGSPTCSLALGAPIDTTDWIVFRSERYGFDIAYPCGWIAQPSTKDWDFEVDAKNWRSSAQESFIAPNLQVRVSAWSVALAPGTTIESWTDVEPWIEAYCQESANAPCTGIHDRAVPMCNESRDCHPGLLVPFEDDVQAFFTGGNFGDRMVVVAVWWGESQPAVAPFGGSQRLLEAFLSTMGVFPPSGPDNHP